MGRPKKEKPNRKDGCYEVKVTVGKNFDGTLIRKSFYSKRSKEDARAKAEQYKIEQAVKNITGESITSIGTCFDTWARKVLESLKGTVKDSSYNLTYRNSIENHLIPYFKKAHIQEIKQIDIQLYFNKKANEYTIETLKKHRMALSRIFESALQNGLIHVNPCTSIKLSSKKETKKKQTYTEEQCKMVLAYATTHRYGLDVILLLSYGITRSELLGIQWDDIDFEHATLKIERGVTDVVDANTRKSKIVIGKPKNDFRKREIPISSDVVEILKNREKNSIFVFCTEKGTVQSPRTWSRRHYDVFMKDMHTYYMQQGVDVPILHPHELRHTRATLWVNSGANLFAVATVLGHADLKMLRKRYAHEDTESTRNLLGIK